MTTTLERVRAAVIKAVPSLAENETGCPSSKEYDIALADVLRAMPVGVELTTKGDEITMVAYSEETGFIGVQCWKLPLPLHLQSEEALTFLDKILNHD